MAAAPTPIRPPPAVPAAGVRAADADADEQVGRSLEFLREIGDLVIFGGRTLRALPGSLRYASEGLRQAAMIMRGTLLLVFVMEIFIGFSSTNFAFFFLRSIGASDYMGVISGYAGPRELAPTMFAYVFTARVCCGMAAELGAMRIQQEIDALESTGVDPMQYLIGPRILGVILFVPVGAVVALIAILIGIYVSTVIFLHGIAPHVLLDVNWSVQTVSDQLIAILTIGVVSVVTAVVACFYGLRTTGGPAAVGTSVARSLFMNLVLLHLIAVFFAVLFYGSDLRLPIGG